MDARSSFGDYVTDLLARFETYIRTFYEPLGWTETQLYMDGGTIRGKVVVAGRLPESDDMRHPPGVIPVSYEVNGPRWSIVWWAPADVAAVLAR